MNYHAVRFDDRQEAAAFVAALSRYISSPNWRGGSENRTEVRLESEGEGITFWLSEPAFAAAREAFAPVPATGEVRSLEQLTNSRVVLTERSGAWGITEAERHLYGRE